MVTWKVGVVGAVVGEGGGGGIKWVFFCRVANLITEDYIKPSC